MYNHLVPLVSTSINNTSCKHTYTQSQALQRIRELLSCCWGVQRVSHFIPHCSEIHACPTHAGSILNGDTSIAAMHQLTAILYQDLSATLNKLDSITSYFVSAKKFTLWCNCWQILPPVPGEIYYIATTQR